MVSVILVSVWVLFKILAPFPILVFMSFSEVIFSHVVAMLSHSTISRPLPSCGVLLLFIHAVIEGRDVGIAAVVGWFRIRIISVLI